MLGFGAIPAWTIVVFSVAVAAAFSPNILYIYGIHNDYEMLYFRGHGFLHPEANALFAIARPVAALLTNLTMFPVDRLADFRWTRLFSLLTMCFLAAQLLAVCIRDLRMRPQDSLGVALATFLALPFLYSVLNATAWPPHLLTISIALIAYSILSRSNVLVVPLGITALRGGFWAFLRGGLSYIRLKSVWAAALVYQLALLDYPPNALILALLPVAHILLGRSPERYRRAVALRDIAFIGVNLLVFMVFVKVVYLPIAGLFLSMNSSVVANADPVTARIAATYRFAVNIAPEQALGRFRDILRVAADLWFLPQGRVHVLVGIAVVAAFALAGFSARHERLRGRVQDTQAQATPLARYVFTDWFSGGALTIIVIVSCLIVSGAPVLAAANGILSYRTIAVPTAIVGVVFLYSLRGGVEVVWHALGSPLLPAPTAGAIVLACALCAATGANFYANYTTMKLSRNELAYVESIVRNAMNRESEVIVLIDPRPFLLPEDLSMVYDQRGRAVPPYEMGCFSGYCLQTTAIFHIAGQELGFPINHFKVVSERAEVPVPGLTCDIVLGKTNGYPPKASRFSIETVDWLHRLKNPTCINYVLDWHDLSADPRP